MMCEFHESTCNGFGDIWWTDNPIYFSSIDVTASLFMLVSGGSTAATLLITPYKISTGQLGNEEVWRKWITVFASWCCMCVLRTWAVTLVFTFYIMKYLSLTL